jgi:uncharacterized protein
MYPRHAEVHIRQALRDTPVVSISGPRQSGKTTLARKFEANGRQYVTLDSVTQRNAAQTDPESFIAGMDRAIIDEVQRAPDLLLAIKKSIDDDRRPGRFILTGSANMATLRGVQESLAGRIETVSLYPLARAEILRVGKPCFLSSVFRGETPKALIHVNGDELLRILVSGGYPATLLRKTEARRQAWCKAYVQTLVQQDIPDVSRIEKPGLLPKLLQVAARMSGQLLNLASLGRNLGLDRKTVDQYLHALEQLYVFYRLPPWHRNELARLIKTPKAHFLDSGLLAALARLSMGRLRTDRTAVGSLLECHILSELLKHATWWDDDLTLSYYRDKDQYEVDFVLENSAANLVGIEAKAAATVQAADFRGLKRLQAVSGDAFVQGIVLYTGSAVVNFGPRMRAVPINSLWN